MTQQTSTGPIDPASTMMDFENLAPAIDRPGSGGARPGSGGLRKPPRAPQSEEVAQRLIRSSVRPVQRFDSADYFLQLHNEQQKRLSGENSASSSAAQSPKKQPEPQKLPGSEGGETPLPPPPLSRDAQTGSP